jgi:hypothetical protein
MGFLDWKYRPNEAEQPTEKKQKAPAEVEEKPEGFASKNVKTITFLICLGVLLAVIGPISVFHIYHWINDGIEEQAGKPMTEQDVTYLSSLGKGLTMEMLRTYAGESSVSDYREFYYIYFENYILLAVQDTETRVLDFCTLTDKTTGDSIEIRTDDVAAFFASH